MPALRRGSRKGLESSSVGAPSGFGSYLSRSMNSPSQEPPVARKTSPSHSQDGSAAPPADDITPATKPVTTKNRNRRASEGSHLMKGEGKRSAPELRCDRCGKGYKHGSCLSKHMCVLPLPATLSAGSIGTRMRHVGSVRGRLRGRSVPLNALLSPLSSSSWIAVG
jgi:hypothetical protein